MIKVMKKGGPKIGLKHWKNKLINKGTDVY